MDGMTTTFRDHLVVAQAKAHLANRHLARQALARGDMATVRYHLGNARRNAKFVRAVAHDCERELEQEAWLAQRAALPAPEVLDSDFGEFLDAQEQHEQQHGGTQP